MLKHEENKMTHQEISSMRKLLYVLSDEKHLVSGDSETETRQLGEITLTVKSGGVLLHLVHPDLEFKATANFIHYRKGNADVFQTVVDSVFHPETKSQLDIDVKIKDNINVVVTDELVKEEELKQAKQELDQVWENLDDASGYFYEALEQVNRLDRTIDGLDEIKEKLNKIDFTAVDSIKQAVSLRIESIESKMKGMQKK